MLKTVEWNFIPEEEIKVLNAYQLKIIVFNFILQAMFEEIDKNKHGEVSNEEVITYLKIMSDEIVEKYQV